MNHITPAKRDLPDYFNTENDSTEFDVVESTGPNCVLASEKKKLVGAIQTSIKHGKKMKDITKDYLADSFPECQFLKTRNQKSVGQVLSNIKVKMGTFAIILWCILSCILKAPRCTYLFLFVFFDD